MKCNDFLMLTRRDSDTLWPWPLTRWPWKFVVGLMSRICGKFDRNRTNGTIPGWVIHNLATFGPAYVTLWSWPLTPWPWTWRGRWRVMWSIYVPNLNKIGPSAAELLTINDRFFVRFRGCCNTARGDFKNAWTDLHQTWWRHYQIIATPQA